LYAVRGSLSKTGPWHPNSSLFVLPYELENCYLWDGFPLRSSSDIGVYGSVCSFPRLSSLINDRICAAITEVKCYLPTEIELYCKSRYSVPFVTSRTAEAETELAWNTQLTRLSVSVTPNRIKPQSTTFITTPPLKIEPQSWVAAVLLNGPTINVYTEIILKYN